MCPWAWKKRASKVYQWRRWRKIAVDSWILKMNRIGIENGFKNSSVWCFGRGMYTFRMLSRVITMKTAVADSKNIIQAWYNILWRITAVILHWDKFYFLNINISPQKGRGVLMTLKRLIMRDVNTEAPFFFFNLIFRATGTFEYFHQNRDSSENQGQGERRKHHEKEFQYHV